MTDWTKVTKPKMQQIVELLSDPEIDKMTKHEVVDMVEHLFIDRPTVGANPTTVVMDQDTIVNFHLDEWLSLHQRFKQIQI